jgi:hypothetical protein
MLVHGGINEEFKKIFDDICLYDIPNRRWISISLTGTKKVAIGKRYMHSIASVVSPKLDSKVILKTLTI